MHTFKHKSRSETPKVYHAVLCEVTEAFPVYYVGYSGPPRRSAPRLGRCPRFKLNKNRTSTVMSNLTIGYELVVTFVKDIYGRLADYMGYVEVPGKCNHAWLRFCDGPQRTCGERRADYGVEIALRSITHSCLQ